MKSFTPLQQQLLNILSDGACHSGQHLGDKLNISRTAIWKHIEKLETLGLIIERVLKRGYRLKKPFIPLSEKSIRESFHSPFIPSLNLHVFASIDSTNRFLKTQPYTQGVTCCVSETQTKGRGRFGRHWHSPFGENIYCSVSLRIDGDPSLLSGLSLVVSLAMHTVLQKHSHQSIAIKWPNDLLWNDKKLAGTLIEMTAEGNNSTDIIIGIGLNINSVTSPQKNIDKPWCSLSEITQQVFDRNTLISELLSTLIEYLHEFKQKGFIAFQKSWNALDYLKNRTFTISQPTGSITGKGCGVNNAGYLQLKDQTGVLHTLSSGDTTLAQEKT
ncbi:MAG: biotin--[acetyl-CoA-carboxylase] ligase [Gammaproteobacteria bacterium]|nr:biotin--[acetyl-CoA-carboxylase] ligase [Gammaproteobacteria bacterium]